MAASREFVCIRPQTYESEEEAKILSWVFGGSGGALRNTSFGILSPDGKRKLGRTGRSPSMVYGTAPKFVKALEGFSKEWKTTEKKPVSALPDLPDLRIALDVAACDLRPLVVLYAKSASDQKKVEASVAKLSWGKEMVGRYRFVTVVGEKGLEGFEGLKLKPGVNIVQADAYGLTGSILAHCPVKAETEELEKALLLGLKNFDAKAKNVRKHIRQGEAKGIDWETAVPVPDTGSKGARRR